MVKKVKKRDGRIVDFDQSKIVKAIYKAMQATGEGNLERDPYRVAEQVVKTLNKLHPSDYIPGIEEIQDIVEEKLIVMDFPKTAKAYILYRQERARIREQRKIIPERVRKLVRESRKYFRNSLGEFIYYRTYSRWIEEEGRRETWIETVERYISFMKEKLGKKLSETEYNELKQAILKQEVMPSMRLLWSSGKAARSNNVAAYNCSYIAPTKLSDFAEIMFLLMSGAGVGFSVESQVVQQLPIIKNQTGKMLKTFVIPDSKEGWADALTLGLKTWFNGKDIKFDFSKIRPAGARLRTMGGRSSGPEPLKSLLEFARNKILSKQGRRLSNIDVHDIICKIGEVVVAGGVRRSALISLSDLDDEEMRNAKSGQFYYIHPQRVMANNSAVYTEKPSASEFMEEWLALAKSGTGERGIFNRGGLKKQMPLRRWEKFKKHWRYSGTNPCLTGDTLVYVADGRGNVPIKQLAEEGKDVPVFCLDNEGKVVVRYMRHPRLTGKNQPVYKVVLDDGSVIKATANHKFKMKSGEYKEVEKLKKGDSLYILTRFEASIKEILKDKEASAQSYWWVNSGFSKNKAEHRLIAQFYYNQNIPKGYVVHHKDGNSQNNIPQNLQILPKEEHDALHGELMSGDRNPMRRAFQEWDEQKWREYKLKHSRNNKGDKNKRFCGISNEKLREYALELTKKLGRRFSHQDWLKYAKENGLPQHFSKWRRDHLGGIRGLAKWAAQELGYEHIDEDPRVVKTYKKYLQQGYDCEILNGKVFVVKRCEVCGRKFRVKPFFREVGACSVSCSLKIKWQDEQFKKNFIERLNAIHQERKQAVKEVQAKVYSDLKFKLGREPLKSEWARECKKQNISTEISRGNSPFRSYSDLKSYAADYNHKVVSVELVGYEDVYNGTVDEFHNFFVGAFSSKTKTGKTKFTYLNNLNCGEIILRSKSFCNLTEVVARENDTEESLLKKIKLAAILGTYQSTLTDFPYISKDWKRNCEEERLLGVSITGQWDCPAVRKPEVLRKLRERAVEVNKEYAKRFGINPSLSVTCVKPSGTVSQLVDASSGMHPRHAPYYIRRIRISATDPLFQMLKDQKIPYYPEVGQLEQSATTYVLEFPVKSPRKGVFRNDLTALQQLEYWKMVKENYTEHNPSVTISVGNNEWIAVANWLYENWDIIGGLSFLPREEHLYQLAPYEEISEEKYKELIANFPEIDFSQILIYEKDDETTGAKALACEGATCELDLPLGN
jgi:ribonucleotide reductase alpha subunit